MANHHFNGVGLNPSNYPHYTEHLAVICNLTGSPLLLTDPDSAKQAEHYYPGLKTVVIEWKDFNPEYLIQNYDLLFHTEIWGKERFHSQFHFLERKYQKKLINVHCPHGFSDKIFWLKLSAEEENCLIYGKNFEDLLRKEARRGIPHLIYMDNIRYSYFKEQEEFYRDLIKNEFFDPQEFSKTILYAPTWEDAQNSTTFFKAILPLLENLPQEYRLIIKFHPKLEEAFSLELEKIVAKYSKKRNICFLKKTPLIYPFLHYTDIYLGDASSIGYDFLVFNRPMFFLSQQGKEYQLNRCGEEIPLENIGEIYSKIDASEQKHLSSLREELYMYTFGEIRSYHETKKDILSSLENLMVNSG